MREHLYQSLHNNHTMRSATMISSLWGNNDPSYHPHDPPLLPTGHSRTTLVLAAFHDKPAKVVVIAAIVSMTATSSIDSRSSDGFVEVEAYRCSKKVLIE